MATLREWMRRLWGTLRKNPHDREMEEELRSHLESAKEDVLRRGGSTEDALRQARLQAGGVAQAMEALRDQRGLPWLEDLALDVCHGIRALRGAPVFTLVAILTLALGIGANTAILSIVNGVLLRPLAYPRPAQLMYLTTNWRPQFPVAVAEYLEFQQFNRSFSDVGAFRTGEANLTAGDRAIRVRSAVVDAHLLKALGLEPAQGRLFTRDDGVVSVSALPGGVALPPAVAIISYDLWESAFGAQSIVGRSIDLDGRRIQVVGIMARDAVLMDNDTQIWLPLAFTDRERLARNNHNLALIGRLKEGVTAAAAQTELNALTESWSARTGITPGGGHAGHVFQPAGADGGGHMLQMTSLTDQVLGRAGQAIWVLQAAVGLVLLIACANVANLLLARAETRRREFAVLMALGARRGRLLRKALTESVILSITGGALGVLLARAGVEALIRAYPASLPRIGQATVDLQVMLVSFALAILCGLLFGLAPMMHARSATMETLRSGLGRSTGTPRHHLRRALVMAETALAVIVVVGAGLLLRTVHNLAAVDSGFDRSRLVTFSIALPPPSFDVLPRARAYQRLLGELRAVPGVQSASAMTSLPLDRQYLANQTEITNNTAPGPSIPIDYQRVMSGFFETTGIPILQGRGFQSADVASEGAVAVVNEAFANTYWKGRDPIGQQLRPAGTMPWFTVIGVAKDVKQTGVDQPVGAEAYVFVDQIATDSPRSGLEVSPTMMHVVARTTLPLSTLAPTIERVVRDVAPSVPVARLREMDEVFGQSILRPRLLAQLLTLFSVLSLLLAAIGTYGVLASMAAERRHEMGIRLALGATRSRVLFGIMKQGLVLSGIGIAVGLAGAFAMNALMTSLLFGVRPTDTATLVAATATIMLVAAAASWLPAWRTSRLHPTAMLRDE